MRISAKLRAQLRRDGFVPSERALERQFEADRRRRLDELVASGMSPDEAESRARLEVRECLVIEVDPETGWIRVSDGGPGLGE